jgi:hypothetical protein
MRFFDHYARGAASCVDNHKYISYLNRNEEVLEAS